MRVAISLIFTSLALAHPVTFEGGSMPYYEFKGDNHSVHFNHSFSNRFALGAHLNSIQDKNKERLYYYSPTANFQIKRWNNPDSQANIYLLGGPAFEAGNKGALVGYQLDWEDRRFYTATEGHFYEMSGSTDHSLMKFRAGVAPYIAPFDGFHTFLILEAQREGFKSEEEWSFGPVARFFYDAYLAEIGVDNDGEMMGSLMLQLYF